ncbi:MAG TPA: hypothetical protein VJ720_12230 [Chitinophaga sp.]|nr:hypothetical protein [Chitinophaga sp.]
MKTSNKLLFSFIGFVILMMIASDVVLRANYNNGRFGNHAKNEGKKTWIQGLPPFKVLKIEGKEIHTVTITRGDTASIIFENQKHKHYEYTRRDDTLFLKYEKDLDFRMLQCPDLSTLVLVNTNAYISEMKLNHLKIVAGNGAEVRVVNSNIDHLDMEVGNSATVEFSNSSAIDSLSLALGKHSALYMYDVPFRYTHLQLDSLRELSVTGSSLSSMKEMQSR